MAKQLKREELTKEMVQQALKCKDADELLALAKSRDYEMTREEAEAYIRAIDTSGFSVEDL